MEHFNVIRPSPVLAPFVKHYWFLRTGGVAGAQERTIPTGFVNLVFHRGALGHSSLEGRIQPRCFASGITNTFNDLLFRGQVDMAVVVFYPWAARLFFTMPLDEFRGRDISAADLQDKELSRLEERLFATHTDTMSVIEIKDFLRKRLAGWDHNLLRMRRVIESINSQPDITVRALAERACLGEKQFNRVFSGCIGTTPKEFTRIVRFQRALFHLQTMLEITQVQLAADCGYFDQSHMIREFRRLSGYTPTEYLAVCRPLSDYFTTY